MTGVSWASGDTRDRVEEGGELGHADARHDAGRADGARPDAHLDGVRAGIDQRLGALAPWPRCRR